MVRAGSKGQSPVVNE